MRELIDGIIVCEWNMFQAVNEGGPRADCQEDPQTFDAMRRAQFSAWSEDAARSYACDLAQAQTAGRNLVAEKYIHMMRNTDPDSYAELIKSIPAPTERAVELAGRICGKMIAQTAVLHAKFPKISDSGRPLTSEHDSYFATSIETYQTSELLTYSESTLAALSAHIDALEAAGESLAEKILLGSIMYYGYKSLEQAETAAAQWKN